MANAITFGTAGSSLAVNQLSDQLRDYAKAQCSLTSLVRVVKAPGKKSGQSVLLPRAGRLSQQNTTSPLGETTRTPDATIPFDSVTCTMYEYGVAVTHADLLEQLTQFDVNNSIQKELTQWLAETRDALVFNQLNATRVSYTPLGTAGAGAGTFDTDGTLTPVATRNIDANDVVAIKNKLKDVYKCPRFADGTYHFHAPATVMDLILRDARVQAVMNAAYQGRGDNAPTVSGQLVRWNGITFIEDNFAIPATLLSATNYIGGGFMVGDDAVGEATAKAPRLYLDPPMDGERFHRVVMRGTWGVKLIWGGTAADVTANQVRVIKVASAVS